MSPLTSHSISSPPIAQETRGSMTLEKDFPPSALDPAAVPNITDRPPADVSAILPSTTIESTAFHAFTAVRPTSAVLACVEGDVEPPTDFSKGPTPAQRRQLDAILRLTSPQSHAPSPPYFIPRPTARAWSWSEVLEQLPWAVHSQCRVMLTGPELRRPNRLLNAQRPAQVNAFLEALARAFPNGSTGSGPQIMSKEIVSLSTEAVVQAFGDEAHEYMSVHVAVGRVRSARFSTLFLVSPGPALTYQQSTIHRRLQCLRSQADEDGNEHDADLLEKIIQRASLYHRAGWLDWHEVVVFIRQKKTFIYDPSCISWETSTPKTEEYFRQCFPPDQAAQIPPEGINSHKVANISLARQLWLHAFNKRGPHSQGRLGQRFGAGPVWIGGGGNFSEIGPGRCRPMAANWMVVVALLDDATKNLSLSEEARLDALRNLDWILGGNLNGESTKATASSVDKPPTEWWLLHCH